LHRHYVNLLCKHSVVFGDWVTNLISKVYLNQTSNCPMGLPSLLTALWDWALFGKNTLWDPSTFWTNRQLPFGSNCESLPNTTLLHRLPFGTPHYWDLIVLQYQKPFKIDCPSRLATLRDYVPVNILVLKDLSNRPSFKKDWSKSLLTTCPY